MEAVQELFGACSDSSIFLFMKVRSSIKKRHPNDRIVRRRGRLYLINKKDPRRKMRQR